VTIGKGSGLIGSNTALAWQSFFIAIVGLTILTVLTVTGDIDGTVSVPIISGIVGAATGAGAQKALNGGPSR
jgi:hypothetical protein